VPLQALNLFHVQQRCVRISAHVVVVVPFGCFCCSRRRVGIAKRSHVIADLEDTLQTLESHHDHCGVMQQIAQHLDTACANEGLDLLI